MSAGRLTMPGSTSVLSEEALIVTQLNPAVLVAVIGQMMVGFAISKSVKTLNAVCRTVVDDISIVNI